MLMTRERAARHRLCFDEGKIDQLFAAINQCYLPGAAVGIAIDGKPVYRKGFGLASIELPIVLSPTIRMRIGSISKHFTALAYMLLCEDGKAGLDDQLGKYLSEIHPVSRRVTMRQLMGNISGLRDVYNFRLQFAGIGGRLTSSSELLQLYQEIDDVNVKPGTAWLYNNGGYLLLSAVVERVGGSSLEEFLRERIFEPVGMHATLLRRWDSSFVPNSATTHMRLPSGAFERLEWGVDWAGGGAIASTVDDMLRWLAHMDHPLVGSAETWAAIKSPQTLANGTSAGDGFGLFTSNYRGLQTLSHAASWTGGNAKMLKIPAAGLDIVVMVNRHDVWATSLACQLLDACVSDLDPEPATSDRQLHAEGVFRSPTTGRVVQLLSRDGKPILSADGHDVPCIQTDQGELRPVALRAYVKWVVTPSDDSRKPKTIRLDDFGNVDDLVRQAPVEPRDVSSISGRYHSAVLGIDATISQTITGPQLVTVSRFGSAIFALECIADGVWRARHQAGLNWGGLVTTDSDLRAFYFTDVGNRSLVFHRQM
jgi:CubicO group peptidase (beta-lactamase class C family)